MKIYVHDCEVQVRLFTFKKVHRTMVSNGPNLSPAFYYIPHCKTWCKPLKHNDL